MSVENGFIEESEEDQETAPNDNSAKCINPRICGITSDEINLALRQGKTPCQACLGCIRKFTD